MRLALQGINERLCLSVPGEPAADQLQRGNAGAPAEAEFARERLAGATDREIGGGKADRSNSQHRRLLLHWSTIAPPAPAGPTGDHFLLGRALDGDRSIIVVVGVVVVMPFDCRWWAPRRGYRRRLLAVSSCFYHERRGDDADAR